MKLPKEFYRLSMAFDAGRLRAEVDGFRPEEWQAHPSGYQGNSAIRLITVGGTDNDDVAGPMRATPQLDRCPYIRQVLAQFGVAWSRSRLMKLGPRSTVPEHSDLNYHWFNRVRVHIPIVTAPEVQFHCGDQSVHMGPGEAWIFDNWRRHRVENPTDGDRVHLVADTVGSARFWDAALSAPAPGAHPVAVPYRPGYVPTVLTERYNTPVVMPPSEVEALLGDLRSDLAVAGDDAEARRSAAEFKGMLDGFCREWRLLWSLFADSREGWDQYRGLRDHLKKWLDAFDAPVYTWSNKVPARAVVHARVLKYALNIPGAAAAEEAEYSMPPPVRHRASAGSTPVTLDRPIVIVSAPRSGSTLLFETLACSSSLWTVGGETHTLIESLPELVPGAAGVDSNRLLARHASERVRQHVLEGLARELRDFQGQRYDQGAIRFLEKTPKHALRVPFFDALFPDALFVFLWRDARANISSIMEAWRSGGWVTYPALSGWDGPWSLLLPPGWQTLRGKPLEEIAAYQWECTNRIILEDLERLPARRRISLCYEDFLADPAAQVRRLCAFAGVPFDAGLQARTSRPLPLSRYTHSVPDPQKWKRNAAAIERVLPQVGAMQARLEALTGGAVEA